MQPPPQKLLPEHAQTLERYAWESFDPHSQGKHTSIFNCRENVCILVRRNPQKYIINLVNEIVWSHVNMVLDLSFSDPPAWECFPAPPISRGKFRHPHTCTVQRISWSFLTHTGKVTILMAFTWQWQTWWSSPSFPSGMKFFYLWHLKVCVCVLLWSIFLCVRQLVLLDADWCLFMT